VIPREVLFGCLVLGLVCLLVRALGVWVFVLRFVVTLGIAGIAGVVRLQESRYQEIGTCSSRSL